MLHLFIFMGKNNPLQDKMLDGKQWMDGWKEKLFYRIPSSVCYYLFLLTFAVVVGPCSIVPLVRQNLITADSLKNTVYQYILTHGIHSKCGTAQH